MSSSTDGSSRLPQALRVHGQELPRSWRRTLTARPLATRPPFRAPNGCPSRLASQTALARHLKTCKGPRRTLADFQEERAQLQAALGGSRPGGRGQHAASDRPVADTVVSIKNLAGHVRGRRLRSWTSTTRPTASYRCPEAVLDAMLACMAQLRMVEDRAANHNILLPDLKGPALVFQGGRWTEMPVEEACWLALRNLLDHLEQWPALMAAAALRQAGARPR